MQYWINKGVSVFAFLDLLKKKILAYSDLLLNIPLAGGQSLKWINHEREAQMIYPLMTDQHTVIY